MVRNPGNVNNCGGCGWPGKDGLGGKRGVPVAGEDKGVDSALLPDMARLRGNDVWVARFGELIFVRP